MSLSYTDRLANYLRQNGPTTCSAPELTHLTGPQRRRLTHKLNHRKAASLRRNLARREATS